MRQIVQVSKCARSSLRRTSCLRRTRRLGGAMAPSRAGFTLIEILAATALALLMLAALTTIFATVSAKINQYRATIAMRGELRGAILRLQQDLQGATAAGLEGIKPPLDPSAGLGHFELVEGPVGPIFRPQVPGRRPEAPRINAVLVRRGNSDPTLAELRANDPTQVDTTAGDMDDMLMFTSKSVGQPFVGRTRDNVTTSYYAEICWFTRGNALYRRVLLIQPPAATVETGYEGHYLLSDVAVRMEGGGTEGQTPVLRTGSDTAVRFFPLSLGDLTKRENRFSHRMTLRGIFPYDVRRWGRPGIGNATWDPLWWTPTLPIHAETSLLNNGDPRWRLPLPGYNNPNDADNLIGAADQGLPIENTPRISEDLILTNVLAFDVKVWDAGAPIFPNPAGGNASPLKPGDPDYLIAARNGTPVSYGAFVDLNYLSLANNGPSAYPISPFGGPCWPLDLGQKSQMIGSAPGNTDPAAALPSVYCSWSTHYEYDGVDQDGDGLVDEGRDGLNNDNRFGVDDPGEQETAPPYAVPLTGIQVTIRAVEPDSQEVREMTIVEEFSFK